MFTARSIGTLHTPWRSIAECPRNGRQPDPAPLCTAMVLPDLLKVCAASRDFPI